MDTQALAKKIRENRSNRGFSAFSKSEKWQGALAGAAITLVLTLTVTSLQFLLFTGPAQYFSITQSLSKYEADTKAESDRDTKLEQTLDAVVIRQDARAKKMQGYPNSMSLHTTLDTQVERAELVEIEMDKGLVEAFADDAAVPSSVALSVLQCLNTEEEVWEYLLDSKPNDPEQTFWRKKVMVLGPAHRMVASLYLWRDSLVLRQSHVRLATTGFLRQLHVLIRKMVVAAVFLFLTYSVFVILGLWLLRSVPSRRFRA